MQHSLGFGSRVGICHSRHSSHIMAAGDSGIPVHPGSCWRGRRDAIALKPPEANVPPVCN